jgi:hypothetical protein
MPFKATSVAASITEIEETQSGQNRSCAGSPRSRRRDGGRGEDVSSAVGRHLTNHATLDSAHHFPSKPHHAGSLCADHWHAQQRINLLL